MPPATDLPVRATIAKAYGLLWVHRLLQLKAVWTPVVFLVAAEFLYHRVFGNAEGVQGRLQAALNAPWYEVAGIAVLWLAGLKFLLSFSISWRRHLLLGEKFDPFFFAAPFWRYLGFLLLTYIWLILVVGVCVAIGAPLISHRLDLALVASGAGALIAIGFALWGIGRQAPFFTLLTLDPPQPGWREAAGAMAGKVLRYLAAFALAMVPLIAANAVLDLALTVLHADRQSTAVALGESAFRQLMLFLHFSLGASIGAITTETVLRGRTGASPCVQRLRIA